jgi:hypothetical protein
MAVENNFVQIYDQKKRKRLIKKEMGRLLSFFGEKDDLASGLIELAATQKIILDEAAELIKRDGVVEVYKNGENQFGRKKSSAVEVHTKYSAEYVKTITALATLRGTDGTKADDEFLAFINRGRK